MSDSHDLEARGTEILVHSCGILPGYFHQAQQEMHRLEKSGFYIMQPNRPDLKVQVNDFYSHWLFFLAQKLSH